MNSPDVEFIAPDRTGLAVAEATAANDLLLRSIVMMVDDEATTLDVLSAYLEDAGYSHLVTTTDADQAVQTMLHVRPDVVLLDIRMPGVTGFDVLAQMRARSELVYTPVIVLTSAVDSATKLRALEMGATDILAKPVDASELVLRLRNTLAAKAYQDRLAYLDPLTGLSNRRGFKDQLHWTLQQTVRYGGAGAVLYINLDRFKQVNEALGLSAGDSVLRNVAQRMQACLRGTTADSPLEREFADAHLARAGGDEFLVLLPQLDETDAAARAATRIHEALSRAFEVASHEFFVSASIGIAVFPGDGVEVDDVLQRAAVAADHAKRAGCSQYHFYASALNTRSLQRLSLEYQLRKAVENGEFRLVYQPILNLHDGTVASAEALIRWAHPERGIVGPVEFIAIAEDTGLIVPIGEWVFWEVCRQNKAWRKAGFSPPPIAVNVASPQFRDQNFAGKLTRVLTESGMDTRGVSIEITENVIMDDAKANIRTLQSLKQMGLKIAVDDFGTGYSSLAYLKRFPLDELKIDRSFITDVHADADNAAIVVAIIAMAHSLGLRVVAEGIERTPELEFLQRTGCDKYQGYLCSKPIPPEEFAAMFLMTSVDDRQSSIPTR